MLGVWAIGAFHVPAYLLHRFAPSRARTFRRQTFANDRLRLDLKQAPGRRNSSVNRLLFILYDFPEKNGFVDLRQ
jgi:hypothetical protein